ncbi:hotdog fold thioesterase [Deinococcus wulumuqiensis]|uniref:Esterase n=1 Tax=Deinococcus wulumuqiensis TaxID=980427 RepID=A0AAV4K6U1_9DEIO|nr:PaaI family thioesterase [Deinococcus wulumuqiensis]QII21489.1 PaaI family thioesterase [Deinococcus wulumuqiensis R12]GGI84664.1 putative esterase [Deinococcus wulumuqiensis]GGP29876.1 putative esterase [Deinococcus wulumuqiensis]
MTLHPDLALPTPEDFEQLSPEALAARMNGPQGQGLPGTLGARLGIRYVSVARERVVATMPVEGNRQPAGRLHGGAALALAEELASVGSWLNLDPQRQVAVGVDLSGTHVRGLTDGLVTAEARLSYRGRSLMVWEIELKDERGRTTSLCRCTCNVISMGA